MNEDKAMEWVKALRSGKYIQGKNLLKNIEPDNTTTYCCLGVLAEISGLIDGIENSVYLSNYAANMCSMRSTEGTPLRQSLQECFLTIRGFDYGNLASANDLGVSFKEIANWIEKNYKLL